MKAKSNANQHAKTLHLDAGLPKHRQIFEQLLGEIQSGVFKPQDRLPSEAELGKRFDASRITIAKAVKELQSLGLVSRRAGAGTYVLPKASISGLVFGLLIPDLGRTEIFEPICQGMMRSPYARAHSLLWGPAMNRDTQEREAEQLCHHYISQNVSGIFFAPLEFAENNDTVNALIAKTLESAGIPIVLLDRCYMPYPARSNYDLVGIDNRRTGYHITNHLLGLGARRIVFMALPRSAATVDARIAGYRGALFAAGIPPEQEMVCLGNPDDPDFVKEMMRTCQPEAIVCANDLTAARLMHLVRSGHKGAGATANGGHRRCSIRKPVAGAADHTSSELRRYRKHCVDDDAGAHRQAHAANPRHSAADEPCGAQILRLVPWPHHIEESSKVSTANYM